MEVHEEKLKRREERKVRSEMITEDFAQMNELTDEIKNLVEDTKEETQLIITESDQNATEDKDWVDVSVDEELEQQEQTLLEKVIEFKRKQLELKDHLISLEKDDQNMPLPEDCQSSDESNDEDTDSELSDHQIQIDDFRPPIGK